MIPTVLSHNSIFDQGGIIHKPFTHTMKQGALMERKYPALAYLPYSHVLLFFYFYLIGN